MVSHGGLVIVISASLSLSNVLALSVTYKIMNVASRRAEVVGKWRSWLAAGAANRLQNISLQTAVQLPRSRWVPCETYATPGKHFDEMPKRCLLRTEK